MTPPTRRPLLLLLLALAACGPTPSPPCVIIYMVDTLRHDHLSISGYGRDTTPHLAAFAADAVVFETAYSTSSWTRPATASLLTGLPPHGHGAITLESRVSEDIELVSEALRARGFATSAFVSNVNVTEAWGFDQGFDWFDDVAGRMKSRKAEDVVGSALEHLARSGDVPFFVYIHTMDPHGNYAPPAAFDRFWDEADRPPVLKPPDITGETKPRDLARTIAAYDGEIAYNDHHFGELVAFLRAKGLYDSSLIVFVSDHGEEHADHGEGGHGHTLYEELVRVPLVVKFPGNRHGGTRVAAPASILDVVPTVLRSIGAPLPHGLEGVPLDDFATGSTPADRPLFMGLDTLRFGEAPHIVDAVRYLDYKLVRRSAPQPEEVLYRLADDPHERRDVLASDSDRAELLRELLDRDRLQKESGVHLRMINEPKGDVRVYRGELTTPGAFVDVRSFQFEDGDGFQLSADARRLTFEVTSRNYASRRKHGKDEIVDEDRLVFRLEPPGAELTIEAAGGRRRSLPLYLGSETREPAGLPLTLRTDDGAIVDRDGTSTRSTSAVDAAALPPGVHLIAVPDMTGESVDMDEETRERLRALGYIR